MEGDGFTWEEFLGLLKDYEVSYIRIFNAMALAKGTEDGVMRVKHVSMDLYPKWWCEEQRIKPNDHDD